MTPLEQWTYKQRWLPQAQACYFHSDLLWPARLWLKNNLLPHQWHVTEFADIYQHTAHIESPTHHQDFRRYFCD